MKKLILLFLLAPILLLSQPSFNVTDSEGNNYNSEEILEQGKAIVVQFFSPGENCWPSANSLINFREAWYNTLCHHNDIFFIQIAEWGDTTETMNFINQYSNPGIPTVIGEWQGYGLTYEWMEWGLQWAYECWLILPNGDYIVDIPYMWDLEQSTLFNLLENEGFLRCNENYDPSSNQTTGITECNHPAEYSLNKIQNPIYDLQGRLLTEKPKSGFYIQGEKKYYIIK